MLGQSADMLAAAEEVGGQTYIIHGRHASFQRLNALRIQNHI